MARRRVVGAGVAIALGAAEMGACASFGSHSDDPGADASPTSDAPAADGAAPIESGSDASQADGSEVDGGSLGCARYPATAPPFLSLARRELYTPPATSGPVYPFAITTDATHVVWIEQVDAGQNRLAYDANGTGRILRVARETPNVVEVLAENQARASALARDGDHVYWSADDGANFVLRRASVTCGALPCPVEDLGGTGARLTRLVRGRAGFLVGIGSGGQVIRVETAIPALVPVTTTTGHVSDIASTSAAAFATSSEQGDVLRVDFAVGTFAKGFATFADYPSMSGARKVAVDCDSLWAVRHDDFSIHRVGLAGGTFQSAVAASAGLRDIFDIAADERYVYVAAANGNGFRAFDKSNLQGLPAALAGSYWSIATDDQGTYIGDHELNGPTAGRISMFVKP